LTLVENPSSNVGLFEGTAQLANSTPFANDGILQIANAVGMEVIYEDAKNSNGNPTLVTDTAQIDCESPVLISMDTALVGLNRVRITFETSEPSDATVWYGTSCDIDVMQPVASATGTTHNVELTSLEAETQYAFHIEMTDAAGNVSVDDNNGACYAFSTPCVTTLFNATFTDSDDSFEQESLWHVAFNECQDDLPGHSVGGHLYFGLDDTCTYDGGVNAGSATSPAIDLMGTTLPQLRFNYYLETEQLAGYDEAFVRISTDGTNFAPIASNVPGNGAVALKDPTDAWAELSLDLSAYQDQTIWVQLHFDTVDDVLNDFSGFHVDDVRVLDACAKPKTGAITATLTPAEAIDAGAQWRIDGGTWLTSGAQVIDLALGNHQIEFKSIAGWTKPADKTVQVLADQTIDVLGDYEKVEVTGSLKVNIEPSAAVQNGAMWRVDGGVWQESGAELKNLTAGVHTVEYRATAGYNTPNLESVTIGAGEKHVMTVVYTEIRKPWSCNAGTIDGPTTAPPADFILLSFAVVMFALLGKVSARSRTRIHSLHAA
jgi:hypothetical protein